MDSSIIAKTLLTLGVGAGIGYFIFDYRQNRLHPNPDPDLEIEDELRRRLCALENEGSDLDRGGLARDYLSELPTRYRI